MKWLLVFMMWVSTPIPEENNAIKGWPVNTWESRAIYETYSECADAANLVRSSAGDAAERMNVACVPIGGEDQ